DRDLGAQSLASAPADANMLHRILDIGFDHGIRQLEIGHFLEQNHKEIIYSRRGADGVPIACIGFVGRTVFQSQAMHGLVSRGVAALYRGISLRTAASQASDAHRSRL